MASTETENGGSSLITDRNGRATSFESILFEQDGVGADSVQEPEFFGDLNLDQIVASLTEGREEYELGPFFYRPLHDVEAIHYRHHVLGDLQEEPVAGVVRAFADRMRRMRSHLALVEKLHYARQKQRWFLEAVTTYCEAVDGLREQLDQLELRSRGLIGLRDYVAAYDDSDAFVALGAEAQAVVEALAAVTYTVHIRGNRVRVGQYDGEPDMSEEIGEAFAKFKRGAVKDYRVRIPDFADMNHVEAQILDLVARLHPETFSQLEQFCRRHQRYLDDTIGRFDREVQFYLAYLEYIAPLKANGLTVSQPRVSARSKDVRATEAFDLALAVKLVQDSSPVVCNDFHLTDPERILVVSGPNNGGKTTFARMFGQLHYLASLGLPVPGGEVRLFLPDGIFTHFEREEEIETLRGKFEDELVRIHDILDRATSDSVLIMNESFGSTTLRDALLVGTAVVRQIADLEALCVFVTFVDELASLSESTVSMMSTVVPEDPAVRTYKVVRKPADGLAYAAAIADKYRLSYEALRERIAR
jgi:DNA mismatch repair protein MutS